MEAVNHADILRGIYPRVLARTLGFTGSLPEAEDAVQEAVVRALSSWPRRGTPDVPEAWLLTAAKNAHRDRLRKGKWEAPEQDALDSLARMSPWMQSAIGDPEVGRGWKDELLRLVFACCHPALEPGESAALCLCTVVGLSTGEVASAFLIEPRALEQRLTRARKRLRERGDPDGSPPEQSADRVDAVLRVVHLLFNEGYWSSDDHAPIRGEVCRLAIGLAHSLSQAFANHAEVLGLLALLMLHDARREARLVDGVVVALPQQDRSRYNHETIAHARELLDSAVALACPGPLQVEAAISALHCTAATSEETPWPEIAALYARLEAFRPTPAVRVNRAFAVGQAEGPRAGLALLANLNDGPYVHLVRGTLLTEAGEIAQARRHLELARAAARNSAERAAVDKRLAALAR